MKRTFYCLAVLIGISISACNTIEGAGEDLSAGGRAIANGAHKAKDAIDNR